MEELKRVSNPLINFYFLRFLNDERIDFQKLSPLEAFVKVGNLKMVEFIMNSPINISVGPYNYFWNGVNNAAENSQIEMLKILKSFHPNLFGMRDYICSHIFHATKNGQFEVFKFFIEGISKNDLAILACQYNIVNVAAEHGQLEIVKYFCQELPESFMTDYKGKSTIHFAALNGHLEIVKYLCQKMPTPIVLDMTGNTPIHYAALSGHFEIVTFLTNFTFNPNVPNEKGIKPSDLAKLKGYTNIEKYLVLFTRKKKLDNGN